jgi:hypothetical protein
MDIIMLYLQNLFNCFHPLIEDDKIQISRNAGVYKTDSSILELLPYTGFTISDPIDMINKYELTPIINDNMSHSFISIEDTNSNVDIIDPQNIMLSIQSKINYSSKIGYTNLDIILAHTIRAHELGHNIFNIITPELIQDIKATISVFGSLLFFGTYIIPNEDNDENVCLAVGEYFNIVWLKNRMIGYPDFYQIYKTNKISDDVFYMLSSLYILPPRDDIILSTRQPFIKGTYHNISNYKESIIPHVNKNIHNTLEQYARNTLSLDYLSALHKILIDDLEKLEKNLIRLERFRNSIVINKNFVRYPIYLVNNLNNKKSFKIGNDIKLVATDTEHSRVHLREYFEKHNINCEVILFSQLAT